MPVTRFSGPKSAAALRPFADRTFQPRFAYPEMAEAAEVSGAADGTALGAGFVRLQGARIPWRVRYDEVLLVLQGHVTVHADGGSLAAGPMDCIWLPEGTDLVYEAENALVFYALHPSDWGDREPASGSSGQDHGGRA